MHRKSRLDERISACGDIVKVADLSDKNMKRAALTPEYLPFNDIFGNDNPVCLEVGCGKGKFVCEMAAKNPQVNYVACEKISNVLIEALEMAKKEGLENVYFLNCAAEVLEKYFERGSVERVYLNFSNPLPKEGYKKQRLTHPRFLSIYGGLLKKGGQIIQKTDDENFYAFSLESYKEIGFDVVYTCEDYKNPDEDDTETEHERHFKDMGKRIYRIKVVV
ncbi:MAG: tRNA (guanosine(46)-N7)-methyltransferase TrmB [Clostridia bacterium]|nr:tRNA (guanosine(46)-N7)-methyltransferase TrmB [Clostridia bacterium]